MALVAVVAAAVAGARRPPAEATLRALQPVARRLVVTALASLALSVTLYSVGWHCMRVRRRT